MEWLIIGGIIYIAYLFGKRSSKRSSNNNSFQNFPQIPQKKQPLNQKRVDLSDITLSLEQRELFDLLEGTNKHVFITGKAGTGKSLLLQYFRQNTSKKIVVCAPTGVAALNVGGQTIHSLFKIPPAFIQKDSLRVGSKTAMLLRHVDAVVIDEISMVRPDLMDAIDHLLRQARGNTIPFGGVQIIMFGDLYQLPPVVSDRELHKYFEDNHGGYFFFNAHVWRNTTFEIHELTNIFRQKDEDFKIVLNAVREGVITEEQLNNLNKRALLEIPSEGVVMLATRNDAVAEINNGKLEQLEGKIYEYRASILGNLEESAFPTEEILRLKKGAQVILLKNDREKRWVNGSLGYVHSLTDTEVNVNIDGITYSIPRETWKKIRYYYDQNTHTVEEEVVSSFTQFPLRLAWAITIHKSQGQTYNSVAIDMGEGAFAHGQAYVALSRCTTLDGLYLRRGLTIEDIIVEPKIVSFMKNKILKSTKTIN